MDNNISNSGEDGKKSAVEEDEALSLRDFPLTSPELPSKVQDKRRSSSEPSDFFEFFNDFTAEMSNAEDIIFCGKLMPYHYKNPPHILKSLSADHATTSSRRNYCHSLPEFTRRRTARRLQNIRRSYSRSSVKSEGSKMSKPRWFVMMFGPLKLRPEMELRDIKNRQSRRNPGRLFGGGGVPAGRRSFWGFDLLKVLSCKNDASVAVTASIGHISKGKLVFT